MKRPAIKISYNHDKEKGERWSISKKEEVVSRKRAIFELSTWAIIVGLVVWWIIK